MKTVAWIFDVIVKLTLIIALLFDRRSYLHCIDLDS